MFASTNAISIAAQSQPEQPFACVGIPFKPVRQQNVTFVSVTTLTEKGALFENGFLPKTVLHFIATHTKNLSPQQCEPYVSCFLVPQSWKCSRMTCEKVVGQWAKYGFEARSLLGIQTPNMASGKWVKSLSTCSEPTASITVMEMTTSHNPNPTMAMICRPTKVACFDDNSDCRYGRARSGQVGQVGSGRVRSDQVRSDQVRSGSGSVHKI